MPSPIVAIPRRMNYGRPQITRLGPWPQGMMSRYNAENIGSKSAPFISNFDVLPNGELRQRGPIKQITATNAFAQDATINAAMVTAHGGAWTTELLFENINGSIGVFRCTSATLKWLTVVNLTTGLLVYKLNISCSNIVYYQGKLYGIVQTGSPTGAGTYGKVFSLDTTNFAAGPTYGAAACPISSGGVDVYYPDSITVYKDRLYAWLSTTTPSFEEGLAGTIVYSKSGVLNVLSGDPDAGFFTLSSSIISTGALHIQAVVPLRNTIYIFTSTTTWALSLPSTGIPPNGSLQIISDRLGAVSRNSVVVHENKIFFVSRNGVFELLNSTFTDIGYLLGDRLELLATGAHPVGQLNNISVTNNKLIICVQAGIAIPIGQTTNFDPPLDTFLVFNLMSRAWSCYNFPDAPILFSNSAPVSTLQLIPFSFTPGGFVALKAGTERAIGGALFCDVLTGNVYAFCDAYEPSSIAGNISPIFADYYAANNQNIQLKLWTGDFDGATVETASWKRFYSVTLNFATTKQLKNTNNAQAMTMVLLDHSGNTITNATVNITTVPGKLYYAIKQYTSLRAMHIQYQITFDTNWNGPFSLLNLDVLAKVKQSIQSGQVGN